MDLLYYLADKNTSKIAVLRKQYFQDTEKLLEYLNPVVADYFSQFVDLESDETRIMETSSCFNIEGIADGSIENFVNIRRINDIPFLNQFFQTVNEKLPVNGIFIGCAETKKLRKERILRKYNKLVSYPFYTMDFIVKRVFPKWGPTRKINYILTRGNNRALALPEILGRLISCGFELLKFRKIDGMIYFAVKKVSEPLYDKEPSYGPIFKMKRLGKDKKVVYVYKLRTMHPFSEYLQQYVFENFGTVNGDKPITDFRITRWGAVLRKLWIDELPMIINWFRGDVKLVGVRPLSFHKFSMYPKHLQEKRIKFKPGLIPPFYADIPRTQEEFYKTEERYLDAYEKAPFVTDIKYFFKAWYNIFVRQARSA